MKCPKCGKEMEAGFVQGNKQFYYNKERTRRLWGKGKEAIPLNYNRLAPATSPAWRCPDCEIIAIDLMDHRFLEL